MTQAVPALETGENQVYGLHPVLRHHQAGLSTQHLLLAQAGLATLHPALLSATCFCSCLWFCLRHLVLIIRRTVLAGQGCQPCPPLPSNRNPESSFLLRTSGRKVQRALIRSRSMRQPRIELVVSELEVRSPIMAWPLLVLLPVELLVEVPEVLSPSHDGKRQELM
jgi:hypothetical protein